MRSNTPSISALQTACWFAWEQKKARFGGHEGVPPGGGGDRVLVETVACGAVQQADRQGDQHVQRRWRAGEAWGWCDPWSSKPSGGRAPLAVLRPARPVALFRRLGWKRNRSAGHRYSIALPGRPFTRTLSDELESGGSGQQGGRGRPGPFMTHPPTLRTKARRHTSSGRRARDTSRDWRRGGGRRPGTPPSPAPVGWTGGRRSGRSGRSPAGAHQPSARSPPGRRGGPRSRTPGTCR